MVENSWDPGRLSRQYNTQPTTDRIFQTSMSLLILYTYVESVAGVLLPLYGCWLNDTPIFYLEAILNTTYEYVF